MFSGLTDADFDAYLLPKQRSNVYNRERLEVKQRLLVLGQALQQKLGAQLAGIDGSPFELAASIEHPALVNHKTVESQHLYFSRNELQRRELDAINDRARGVASMLEDTTPQRSHAFLAVSIFHDRLEVSFRIHPEATVDRQNLTRKCQDPYELAQFDSLVRALPVGFHLALAPDVLEAHALAADILDGLLRRFATLSPGTLSGPPALFSLTRSHARHAVIVAADALPDVLGEELSALAAIYRFAAWARDNDFTTVKETLAKQETERRQKGIVRGDVVRVVRGLLSGQRGTVQDVDPRGAMRVLVGKRTVKVDAADVERS
jgi:hypothetical protein